MIELEMEHMAHRYGEGQHTGLKCPACGAHTTDRALSMKVEGGLIQAVCHRASCGFKYSNDRRSSLHPAIVQGRAKPYTGELHSLDWQDAIWFQERFHFAAHGPLDAMRKSSSRYFLPIVAPDADRRGWVSRRPWEGSPLYVEGDTAPKSLTFMDNEEPVMSWHGHPHVSPVVVVEDQISALRVTQDTGLRSVAILGTGVNEEKIAELQRHTYHLVFALDSDATGLAFKHCAKWGAAFETCRVLILRKDVKDETPAMVRKIFRQIAPT